MPKSAHSFEKKYISHICHQDIYSKKNFKLPVNPHGLNAEKTGPHHYV